LLITLFTIFVPLSAGCSAPAPSAKFVALADRLHQGALASAVTTNTDLRDYVQLIGDRVADATRKAVPNRASEQLFSQLHCHLVNCPTINAFYTGGNHVYIYSGFVALCETEDELAAAIAHEYAHAIALDLEKTKLRPDPNLSLPAAAFQFVLNRRTLAQEDDADELAFLLYRRGGWEPAGFARLFEHLSAIAPPAIAVDRAPLPIRAQRIRSQGTDTPGDWRKPPVADPKTFQSLRSQINSAGQLPASPEAELFLRAFPNCLLSGDPPETRDAQERLRPPPPPAAKLEPS
jgi:hypothetical protein